MKDSAAKKLFWKYACNHFYIAHDGVHGEYEKLGGGDKEKESVWRAEYIQDRVERLTPNSFDIFHDLKSANASEAIPFLLRIDEFSDDYSKFWIAFTLNDLASYQSTTKENKKNALRQSEKLWKEILEKPKGITDEHRKLVVPYMLEALEADDAECYVRNYTQTKLKEQQGTTRRWWQRR